MIPVAPRIGNEVSYVTTIKHASHFVWQARYLVRLDGDTCIVNEVSYVMMIK